MNALKKPTTLAAIAGLLLLALTGFAWKQGWLGSGTSTNAVQAANAQLGNSVAAVVGATPSAAAVSVEVTKVQATALREEAPAVGSLRSKQSVIIKPEVAGRVSAIGFSDGQAVRRGQLLLQLDDSLQRAELEQAKAQAAIAQSNFNRNRDLVAQNFVAQRVLDESAANLQVAQAQVKLAEARISRMRINAPFTGTAGLKSVSVGDYVKDGADVVNLEDISTLYADFRLPERYLSQLKKGQSAEVAVDALAARIFKGNIVAIDPLLDAAGRSVSIRAQLDNTKRELRPGMFVRVNLLLGAPGDALMIPEEALVPVVGKVGKQAVVKVVEGKSQRVEVKPGLRREGKVQILGGLKAGDTIVIAGQQRISKDDTPLKVVDLGKPATAVPLPTASAAQKSS